jgi:hypothetical protein
MMPRPEFDVLTALLGPTPRLLDDVPARTVPTALGYAEAPLGPGAAGSRSPIALRSGLRVEAVDRQPGILVVAEDDIVAAIEGSLTSDEDLVLVDSRRERAVLEMVGRLLLVANGGSILVYALPEAAGAAFPAPPVTAPALPPPPVAGWAVGQEAWLGELVGRMAASPRDFDKAASAGTVARLAVHDGRAGSPTVAAARAWIASVPAATWEAVASDAAREATALAEMLDDLPTLGADAIPDLFRRRDRLESVALVLRLADHAADLGDVLREIDRAAAVAMSTLGELAAAAGDWSPDHREAVAWQEPDAWWTLC